MAFSIGGLATGMDTNSIIDQLMQIEQKPINRLQVDKAYHNSRLAAAKKFNDLLSSLQSAAEGLDEETDVKAKSTSLSNKDYFTATSTSEAYEGTYNIEIHSLAQTEKEYSQGIVTADGTDGGDFGTGTLTITVGDADPVDVIIGPDNNSLQGIVDAINAKSAGMTATIINDGTANPYRLVITADNAGEAINITPSLAGGTINTLTMTMSQEGTKAHVKIDGIDVYSASNSVQDAIPGVTLSLVKPDENNPKVPIELTVSTDKAKLKNKVKDLMKKYNDVINFVVGQSKTDSSSAGILLGDSGMNSIKSRLQNLISQRISGAGAYNSLTSLGLSTQKDGTLNLDETKLDKAIDENADNVQTLLIGTGNDDGIIAQFTGYLGGMTDPIDGFYAGRKQSVERVVKKIDESISRISARLEQRQNTLVKQFSALEELVSNMNQQSAYLTQQMSMLSRLTTGSNN